jgi:hypothetical protein
VRQRHAVAWDTEGQLSAAVLGTVISAAVMVGAGVHGTLAAVVGEVLAAVAVYWTVERYAGLLAAVVRTHRLTPARVRTALRGGWPMLEAALLPLAVLVPVALLCGSVRAGVAAALGVTTVLLGRLGALACRRAGYRGRVATLGWAGGSAVAGGLVILLELTRH